MRVYYVRRLDDRRCVRRDDYDSRKTAMDANGLPLWTADDGERLEWTKQGGAYAWVSWWDALWKASHQEPPCEIEVDCYEDPTRMIGGEDG